MSLAERDAGPHEGILARLERPGSARHLAIVRIVLGLHLATVFASPALPLLVSIGGRPHPLTGTHFPAALDAWLAAGWVLPIAHVGLGASVAMTVGLLTRAAIPVVLVCFVLTQGYWFRATLFHDDWLYFTFPLLALSFARSHDALSLDALLVRRMGRVAAVDPRAHRWPIEALVLWFAFTYVAAGLAKLFPLAKGLVWLTGISAQEFAAQFVRESPAFWVLGRAPFDYTLRWPFMLGAFGTVVVELGAVLVLFTDRHRALVFGAVFALHVSIFAMGIPAFPVMALVLGVALIPSRRFSDAADPRDA